MVSTLGSESGNGPVDDGDLPGMYAWSMYCMSSPRCVFCMFSLVPGDTIILALFDGISNELIFVPNSSIVSGADHIHKNHYMDHSRYRTRIQEYGVFMGNSHGKWGASRRDGNSNSESHCGYDCLADAAHPSCFSVALRFGLRMPTVPVKIEKGTGNVFISRSDCHISYAGPRGFGIFSGLVGEPGNGNPDHSDDTDGSDDSDDSYDSMTPMTKEHKRRKRIKNDLAQRLSSKLYPGTLPFEMWHMVAEDVVHECAYVTMLNFITWLSGDIFSCVYLDKPVFASFVRMEDRFYVEALCNRANGDSKVEGGKDAVLIFPGLSAAMTPPYYVRIYTAYDSVDYRCCRMFPVKDAADFDKPTQSEKAW